jgi:biofilm PGA synthesis N-glycosyltransferase PgaC
MQWLLIILIIPYIYLLLKIYIGLVSIKPFISSAVTQQFVSVVIACRNEEINLSLLLNYISKQDYDPGLFEVLVIDDNSSDGTFEAASGFHGIRNLKILRSSGSGKKQAVRSGVEAASGNLIITTDADCRLGKSWLKTITSLYVQNKPGMIICPVRLEERKGFFHKFQELEYMSLQGVTAGTAAAGNPVMCNGANMAFTKEVYAKNTGNLNDEIPSGDDVFLLHSIKRDTSGKILWLESQDAVVITKPADSIGSFIKQRVRWISKAGAYTDRFTRILAIVTFVTILFVWFLLIAGIFNSVFLSVLLVVIILKSVPDFLILYNTASRYRLRMLLSIFIPAQVIYPVYVIVVFLCYLISRKY